MTHLKFARRLLAALLLCLIAAGEGRADTDASEAQRIEYLVRAVEELPDAKFLRNGSAYDAKAAADHLRLKLRNAGARVKTAEDFIRLCASKSSVSGQPYRIRFADGRIQTSEAYLRAKLAELDRLKK